MKILKFFFILIFPYLTFAAETDLESIEKYGDYTVSIKLKDKKCDLLGCERTLFIHKNNKKIYEIEGCGLSQVYYPPFSEPFKTNKMPILSVRDWSGGAHCCYTYYFLDMSKDLKLMQKIDGGDNAEIFKKNNEISIFDAIFGYFYTSFAYSPMPKVYLKFENDKLIFDKEKMLESSKSLSFDKMIAEMDKKTGDNREQIERESSFLSNTIDLIYSGNVNLAWKLIDNFFSKYTLQDISSEELKKQILCQISRSDYSKDIEDINNGHLKFPLDCSEEEMKRPFKW